MVRYGMNNIKMDLKRYFQFHKRGLAGRLVAMTVWTGISSLQKRLKVSFPKHKTNLTKQHAIKTYGRVELYPHHY
jgi:hypothetical protein